MKQVVLRVGSGVVTAAVGYVALAVLTEELEVWQRLVLALVLGGAAFAAAVWAARDSSSAAEMSVASNLKGASAEIEDLHADVPPKGKAEVASGIETSGPIVIKRVEVKSRKKE